MRPNECVGARTWKGDAGVPIWWQDKTAITGIGHTEYGRGLRRSETDLATEAITGAVADAGLEPADIDGLATFSTQSEGTNNYIRQAMPVGNARYYVSVPHGGGGYPAVVANGAMGVAAGQCRHLVAYRAGARGKGSARGEGDRAGGRPWERAGERIVDTSQYQVPFGVMSPVQAVAIIAQRYIHNFGATETGFADVAVAARKHAARNPNAVLREPITSEDHHRSRMVADPLRLLDCCLEWPSGRLPINTHGGQLSEAFVHGANSTTSSRP